MNKIDINENVERIRGSERPKTSATVQHMQHKAVEEFFSSQRDQPGTY